MKLELVCEKKFDNEVEARTELQLVFFPFEYGEEYCSSWANGVVVIEKLGDYHRVTLKENKDMPFYDYKRVLKDFGWTLVDSTGQYEEYEDLGPIRVPIHARV